MIVKLGPDQTSEKSISLHVHAYLAPTLKCGWMTCDKQTIAEPTELPEFLIKVAFLLSSQSHLANPVSKLPGAGRVVRCCWVNFQCRGVLLIWIRVGQGPTALVIGAVGGLFGSFFSRLSFLFSFSLSLGDSPI